MILKADKITKRFGDKTIFDNASLFIDDGELVSLYGFSGSGKSTFSKIVCDVLDADSGKIECESVQMVYQHPTNSQDPSQKIGKAFRELISYHKLADTKDEADSLISEKLSEVGLDVEILQHLPSQISGGEAQRVSLAKALLLNPRLLILDEATSMLDTATQDEILELVKHLVTDAGNGVLFITHDWELAKRVSDRIYVLEDYRFREILK